MLGTPNCDWHSVQAAPYIVSSMPPTPHQQHMPVPQQQVRNSAFILSNVLVTLVEGDEVILQKLFNSSVIHSLAPSYLILSHDIVFSFVSSLQYWSSWGKIKLRI